MKDFIQRKAEFRNGPAIKSVARGWDRWEPVFKLLLVCSAAALLVFAFRQKIIFDFDRVWSHDLSLPVRWLLLVSTLIFLSSWIFRTYRWFHYRDHDPATVNGWPTISVVVPVYNEGTGISATLRRLLETDYPRDRLEIIVVDDGSTDDTAARIEAVRREHPGRIDFIVFKDNRGKRHALAAGFQRSQAEVIVTVDSDTRVDPESMRHLVAPLELDPGVGAVTGRIKVQNSHTNVLTRMLKTHFAMAFDYTRAVQSTFSSVFCSSGAFTAYRGNLLRKVMAPWLDQRFLGRPCTFGEDRSLTNHILRLGFGTLYQRRAVARTIVPSGLRQTLRMFTRWARSNLRESIVYSSFAFSPSRRRKRLLPGLDFFFTTSLLILHFTWFYYALFAGLINGDLLLRLLSFTAAFSFITILYYLRIENQRDAPYLILFAFFNAVFMLAIFTVAGLTITHRNWSTR